MYLFFSREYLKLISNFVEIKFFFFLSIMSLIRRCTRLPVTLMRSKSLPSSCFLTDFQLSFVSVTMTAYCLVCVLKMGKKRKPENRTTV